MGAATSRTFGRLAVAARVFVLLALVGPAVWARDTASFPYLTALEMDPDTVAKVDRRWHEYGIE